MNHEQRELVNSLGRSWQAKESIEKAEANCLISNSMKSRHPSSTH
jgi:organic hydroperoxide reductase OsmC/OhrA